MPTDISDNDGAPSVIICSKFTNYDGEYIPDGTHNGHTKYIGTNADKLSISFAHGKWYLASEPVPEVGSYTFFSQSEPCTSKSPAQGSWGSEIFSIKDFDPISLRRLPHTILVKSKHSQSSGVYKRAPDLCLGRPVYVKHDHAVGQCG